MMWLAHLRADRIQEGILHIRQLVNTHFPNDDAWAYYVNVYYQWQWLDIVTPARFSVYKVVDKTNNYLESYHHTLKKRTKKRPTV